MTEVGAAQLAAARAAVTAVTAGLVEGINEAEQETTRRVLDLIRHRAEESLGRSEQ
ncbi:hypothetical protein [Branchiibius sp. NY16-3462-2]|uniref:hypothetical protein n=1 Tax=Branchiibius sp. NY16-3462-2 TaxID=1807500 RepID=UPI0025B7F390|nr:hypothetical protein [Branchiibius sp. NY16-3462-2]